MTADALPSRYATRGLDDLDKDPDQAKATDLCRAWLDEVHSKHEGFVPSWGIALTGDPGTGKTAIACALAYDAAALKVSIDFITMPDLRYALTRQMTLVDIIRKFDRVDDDTPEIVEHRVRSKRLHELRNEIQLLIIDDLGRELKGITGTNWIEDQIDNLVRHRGDRGLALVVTTNLDYDMRRGRYGESFDSYLHDICTFVRVKGEDWRRAGR